MNIRKKIESVEIHNFQSHIDTKIEFAPLLTTVVGASDAGKSSVIRALRWALFNEPSGTQYMRVGTADTYVRLLFTDGSALLRARDKSKNYYILQNADGESTRLEGFGQKTPSQVAEFTGIRKVQVSEKDSLSVNVAGQLEGPFLLGETPTVRAEAIGRLAGTHRIDAAHRQARADKGQNTRLLNQYMEDEEQLLQELKAYEGLEALKDTIDTLDRIQKRIEEIEGTIKPYQGLRMRWKAVVSGVTETNAILSTFGQLEESHRLFLRLQSLSDDHRRAEKLRDRLRSVQSNTSRWMTTLSVQNKFLGWVHTSELLLRFERFTRFRSLRDAYSRNKSAIVNLQPYLIADVIGAGMLEGKLRDAYAKYLNLDLLSTRAAENKRRREIGAVYYANLHGLDDASARVIQMDQLAKRSDALKSLNRRLRSVVSEEEKLRHRIEETNQAHEHALRAYMDVFRESGQCPYCLSELSEDSMEHLRAHLEKRES